MNVRRLFKALVGRADKLQMERSREFVLPEEAGELYRQSLEMHYGDEPLYLLDPPEWPSSDEEGMP